MRELFVLIAHLFTTVVQLGKPGGLYPMAAEPTDVLHYASTDANFPHQTTVDQFFDEPQFESYRRLGTHVVETILKIGGDAAQFYRTRSTL